MENSNSDNIRSEACCLSPGLKTIPLCSNSQQALSGIAPLNAQIATTAKHESRVSFPKSRAALQPYTALYKTPHWLKVLLIRCCGYISLQIQSTQPLGRHFGTRQLFLAACKVTKSSAIPSLLNNLPFLLWYLIGKSKCCYKRGSKQSLALQR